MLGSLGAASSRLISINGSLAQAATRKQSRKAEASVARQRLCCVNHQSGSFNGLTWVVGLVLLLLARRIHQHADAV